MDNNTEKKNFSSKNQFSKFSNKLILGFIIFLVLVGIVVFLFFQTNKENIALQTEVSGELNIYNWEDYFGETTIEDFEEEFGVKVNLYTFDDEDFMESDVQSNPGEYDLIIASDSLIKEMVELKLLEEINFNNIPNFNNIAPEFINGDYDPGNKYSVPYLWGTTGMVINTKYVPEDTDSWSVLFDEQYSGKITMSNNKAEVIASTLKYLGYSLNTQNEGELDEAKNLLLGQKPLITGYEDPITIMEDLISEEIWIAQQYSGEGVSSMDKNENLKYIIPKEGAALWIDTFAVPADAENKDAAEIFINFVLQPEMSADIANYLWYANTNKAAREFTNIEILEDPSLYPSEEVMQKLEFFKSEPVSQHNEIWAELQAAD